MGSENCRVLLGYMQKIKLSGPIYTKGTPTLCIQYSNPHDQIKAVQRERYVFFIVRAENTQQTCFTLATRPSTPFVPKEPVYLTVVTPPEIAKPNWVVPG